MDSGDSDITDEHVRPPPIPRNLLQRFNRSSTPDRVLKNLFCCWRDLQVKHFQHGFKRGSVSRTGLNVPFIIASMSKRWREIALDTPELWAHIHIYCGMANDTLFNRLDLQIERSGDALVTLYLGNVHASVFTAWWYGGMRERLRVIEGRWGHLLFSFMTPNDVQRLLLEWPMAGPKVLTAELICKDDNPGRPLPATFLSHSQNLRRVHLGNVHSWQHPNYRFLSELELGPSNDRVLNRSLLLQVLQSMRSIEKLTLLTHDEASIHPTSTLLPSNFCLPRLQYLTVSPILFRTSLAGFASERVLPSLVGVSIHFISDDDTTMEEDEDRMRRMDDLEGASQFLADRSIRYLKLRGLDHSYELEWVSRFFLTMATDRLTHLQLRDCGHITTDIVRLALQRTPYRSVATPTPGGSLFLMPILQSLFLVRCNQVNGAEILQHLQGRPQRLHHIDLVMIKTDILPEDYAHLKQHVL